MTSQLVFIVGLDSTLMKGFELQHSMNRLGLFSSDTFTRWPFLLSWQRFITVSTNSLSWPLPPKKQLGCECSPYLASHLLLHKLLSILVQSLWQNSCSTPSSTSPKSIFSNPTCCVMTF